MSETFNYKGINYTIQYNDYLDYWEWKFDSYVGTKNISDNGSSDTKSSAKSDVENEIDWKISIL
jgi:hypothetical protein